MHPDRLRPQGSLGRLAMAVIVAATLVGGTVVTGEASASTSSRTAYVSYVVDGDTVRLTSGRYVRLIGYDTPEAGQRYYHKAGQSLDNFIPDSGRVRLVNPSSVDDTDHYGRLLRYVRVGDRDAGKRLIRQGYGHARYDSRDGYDWHPLQSTYHRIDANTRNLW
jgi:endonuclease YncB( thermonuclease family)